MKRLIIVITLCLVATQVFAADPLRVFVGEFNSVGVQAGSDTKAALQALLASRLNSDKILTVGSAAEAEVLVSGTYLSIGKQYNLDAVARTAGGQTIARTYVQGEGGQEALFGAVGSLAEKLSGDLNKKAEAGGIARLTPAGSAQAALAPPVAKVSQDIVRPGAATASEIKPVQQVDIIHPQTVYHGAPNKGEIKRLDGMFNLLVMGGHDVDGKRLLFLAKDRAVVLLREGEPRPIAGFGVGVGYKILSRDCVDADGSGTPELYVTAVRGEEVSSQVSELKNKRLVNIAAETPYSFRSIALAGGPLKLYAQEQGQDANQFYGPVYEVTRKGKNIVKKTKILMPRYGNLYGFNQLKQANGELLTVVYHPENYLIVYDKEQKELWRSNDAFGGSELYYKVEDLDDLSRISDNYRWIFMNQRIQVTSKQEVLVGKNDGFFVIGNARMYKHGAVYCLYWNGAALEEAWRTKDTQNYMPDFYFDEPKNELLLLQLTQREDVLTRAKGASALQIKKVE